MSIHPSLVISDKGKKHKTVLKRTERLKMMHEKGQWKEGDKVFGLPKIKTLRIKIKKEKAEKAATAEGATATAAAETTAPAAKEQAASKGASSASPKEKK